jgi:hydroxypyruvate isomerase
MNPTRREFLTAATAGAAGLALGGRAGGEIARFDEPTWLTYAINVETFWSKLPFLERLKKVSEAGFGHYEFWKFRAKDILAIDKASKELNLTPVRFTAFEGIADPKKKESFLESIEDAIEVANALGVKKLTVAAGQVVKGLEREAMFDAVVDALKDAIEKVKEHDITLLLGPAGTPLETPRPLLVTSKDAAEVIEAVGSSSVKMIFYVDHNAIREGNPPDTIKKSFDKIGYFHLGDRTVPTKPVAAEIDYPRTLKQIHDLGYKDVIGVEMQAKGDPIAALKGLREYDVSAKELK